MATENVKEGLSIILNHDSMTIDGDHKPTSTITGYRSILMFHAVSVPQSPALDESVPSLT